MKRRGYRLGLCTGGGDCPGLNAAIRAVVRHAELGFGMEIYGVRDGLTGLTVKSSGLERLTLTQVDGILTQGGTILGTNSKGSPFRDKQEASRLIAAITRTISRLKLDGLIVIGGDGSQFMAKQLAAAGLNIIGIPKTIDNDLIGTEQTIGFATAVDIATDAACRLGSSADAHNRLMILEVMGRDAGHIALATAIASGAHAVLLPELPFSLEALSAQLLARPMGGQRGSLVVVAEGAHLSGSDPMFQDGMTGSKQLGGIGAYIARLISERTGIDARVAVLGHVQRGGTPNATDRILAANFACQAVELAAAGRFGHIVGIRRGRASETSYQSVSDKRRTIDLADPMLKTAQALGMSLGQPSPSKGRIL